MTKQLKILLEEIEVYKEDNSDVNFLATGGYDGDDSIEIVQFTKNSPYILRIKTCPRYVESKVQGLNFYVESKVLYFTFENEKLLVDFLEENYR